MKTDVKILYTRIRRINLNIAKNLPKNLTLNADWNTEIKVSKDKDRNVLFLINLKVFDKENKEFDVEMDGEIIFEFNEKPEDLKKISTEKCIPLAQKEMSARLDNILVSSGYSKLDLASKIGLNN